MIAEMLDDPEEFSVIISLIMIMFLMSGIYHICAFMFGSFTILSVTSSQLLDHVTSQGMCVTFSFLFLILNNRRVRDAVIVMTLFVLGLLLIIADVLYFSAFISLAAILTSFAVHSERWAKVLRTGLFWITVFVGALAFVMFFLWELSPWLHGNWHILIFLDGWLLTKIVRIFFVDPRPSDLPVSSAPENEKMREELKKSSARLKGRQVFLIRTKSVIGRLRDLLSPPAS